MKESENIGLNPVQEDGETEPIYLAHLVEHNYLMKTEGDKVRLGGVVIALSLNSVQYETNMSSGARTVKNISNDELKQQGMKMAEEVVKRLRQKDGLKNAPIMIALYKQAPKDERVPGHFFAYSVAGNKRS